MILRCAKQWDAWWCAAVPPHALAIARIAIGSFWLLLALGYAPVLFVSFSSSGVAMPLLGDGYSGMQLFDAPSPFIVTVLYALLLVCLIGFIAGYRMRVCLLGILVLGLEFWQLSLHVFPATIHRISLFFILVFLCSGADMALSLRMHRERGTWRAWESVSLLPQRLLAVQITATYLGAALQKLWLPGWEDGGILRASLMSSWATPLAFRIVRWDIAPSLYDAAVPAIILFEVLLAMSFWIPRVRWIGFAFGAMFHIAIALLLSIWSFLVLIPLYVLFLPPQQVAAWFGAAKTGRRSAQ
jgi:hypothetical protein